MLSIYDWFGYDLPVEERYRLIKDVGFDGVLMWWGEFFGRGKDYRHVPEIARRAGLFIENIHAPTMTEDGVRFDEHLWFDDEKGDAAIKCYLQCIADCATFEIPTMVIHLPSDRVPHTPLGFARMGKIAEKAEHLGVNVALENIANLNNLTYMLEQIKSPRVGFCYDVAHHERVYPEIDLPGMYGERMMALHLHDNLEATTHRLPFDGIIDWSLVMKRIAEADYKGAIALEPTNLGTYDHLMIEEFLQKAVDGAKRLEELVKNHKKGDI